jgi:hypothetical protein
MAQKGRLIPDRQTLIEEMGAWKRDRNAKHTKASWHFTTPDAGSTQAPLPFNLIASGDHSKGVQTVS